MIQNSTQPVAVTDVFLFLSTGKCLSAHSTAAISSGDAYCFQSSFVMHKYSNNIMFYKYFKNNPPAGGYKNA